MKKYLLFTLTIIMLLLTPGTAVFAASVKQAQVTQSTILLDGKNIYCSAFNISGSNYFKLRDLAASFSGTSGEFNVIWNKTKKVTEIKTGSPYPATAPQNGKYYYPGSRYPAVSTAAKLLIDGRPQSIASFNIDGNNYVRLRDLSRLIHFEVVWDAKANTIKLYSPTPTNAHRLDLTYSVNDSGASWAFPRWKSTLTSYLVKNEDKTISVVEANEGIIIQTYDQAYKPISRKKVAYELPLFGGFFSGEKYNYIAFGQENREEKDAKEVIRIVRYDKAFQRIDSVSVKGGESFTIVPFDAGCGRMAEYGNTLVFHTSRTRYTTEDGLNHQSQLTIIVDTSSMTVTNDLGRFQSNHVSHSFDQYVQYDGDSHVLVDHGDAYPRSVVLNKENGSAYREVDLFKIPGSTGANCTGVSIGGFEVSSANYLVAINSIDHSLVKNYTSFEMQGLSIDQRDIIICTVPRDELDQSEVRQITLAKYVGSSKIASIPQLVKISEDNFMVLWQEFDKKSNKPGAVKYVFVDGNGEAASEVRSVAYFRLSSCQPMVLEDAVMWYTNENNLRYFYTIPLDA